MKKYPVLMMAVLLTVVLTTAGCQYLPDEFNNLIKVNEPPVAHIDSISPTEAMQGETITFIGHGTDTNGSIVAYRWQSNIDGELSVKDSFQTSSLSNGHHTIYFKVQDNNGGWSEEISCTLVIKDDSSSLPVISYFTANPSSIVRSNSSKISWEILNASSVTIEPDIGDVSLTGTKTISPNNTTTYTLTATNKNGSVNTAIKITVSSVYTSLPTINSFFASPAVIAPGSSSILNWNVSNATGVSISPGIGTVDLIGNTTVTPTSTTNYTLTARNLAGQVSYNISVVLLTLASSITLNELSPEETLTFMAISTDADGNEAVLQTDQTFTPIAPPDMTPPVIATLNIIPMDISAVVEWVTDEPTSGQVEYGSPIEPGASIKSTKNNDLQHRIVLSGLKPQTTYYFQVRSTDTQENETVSDRGKFTTLAPMSTGVEVGDYAPDFTLDTIRGDTVTLSALRGKLVMVTFWTTGCGACVAEMPDIQAVYETWSGKKDLEVLAVNSKQPLTYIQRFLDERAWCTLPIPLDTDGAVARQYHITRIPRTFFIDSSGIIRKVQQGRFQNQEEIKAILDKLD